MLQNELDLASQTSLNGNKEVENLLNKLQIAEEQHPHLAGPCDENDVTPCLFPLEKQVYMPST